MEHGLGVITNIVIISVNVVAIISISISEARERRRESKREVEEIQDQKIARPLFDSNPVPLYTANTDPAV